MIYKIIIFLLSVILSISLVYAENSGGTLIAKQNGEISLPQECPSCSYCYLTKIGYPNMSNEIIGGLMTKNDTSYNYLFNKTSATGVYIYCTKCDVDGEDTTACKDFEVTPIGDKLNIPQIILYGLSVLLIIIVIGVGIYGMYKSAIVGKSLYLVLVYIFLIALFFISYDISVKYTGAVFLIWFLKFCFLFLLWSFIPLLFLWFGFIIIQLRKARGIQALLDKGIPEDEAIKRINYRR